MINQTPFELAPGRRPVNAGSASLAHRAGLPLVGEVDRRLWGCRLVWTGRAMLAAFAAAAVISANREAGLLALAPLQQLSSGARGTVPVGVAYLLLPAGASLWLAGLLISRPSARGLDRWRLGPLVVAIPLATLLALTLAHLSLSIGWVDAGFVLAEVALLVFAYLFALHDQSSGTALAAFAALAGGVQAAVGLGQFALQHDLGLGWLGELPLNPASSGVSVLEGSTRVLRAYGLMRHPNALGAILPLSLLAAISLFGQASRRPRLLWLCLTVVITAGLVVTFSRAGWLAALAGGGVLLMSVRSASGASENIGRRGAPACAPCPGWPKRRADTQVGPYGPKQPDASSASGGLRWPAWAGWAPIFFSAALVVVAVGLQRDLVIGRLLGMLGHGVGVEHWSLAARLDSTRWAWQVIQHSPLWGVGTQRYVATVAQLMRVRPAESLLVDSTPLLLWAEQGAAGVIAWLGMGAALVWLGSRRGAATADLALATAWVAAIQVVCLFQAYFWPGHELWQGGIWLGLALGLWARAWANSARRSA